MSRPDDFRPPIPVKLAERAAYMCSNPSCMRITVGPCDADPTKSAKTGKAAHICAASPNGPRYDKYQGSPARQSINNGIWLCGACADLIDKNNGADYSVSQLRSWKREHEKAIKKLVESGFNPLKDFLQTNVQSSVAKRVIQMAEDKAVLFDEYSKEDPIGVIKSLTALRASLLEFRSEVEYGSPLDLRLKFMSESCRIYIHEYSSITDIKQMAEYLGELRKVFGIHLKQMGEQYDFNIGNPLASIFPQ